MSGGASGGEEEQITGINVTPLVDIMLCLLVIFMVTTSYVVADSIKLDLPEASTGSGTEPSTVMIAYTLEDDGARVLYLNGEKSTEEGLRAHIRTSKAEGKTDIQAVIAADKRASHGEVIRIIDIVKQEGILKFALNIESPAK